MQTTRIPAPWRLTGEGYVLLYRWNQSFLEHHQMIPPFLRGKRQKGLGAVMIVDYKDSNAGPYQELLFMTGGFRTSVGKRNTIPKIFVSSQASVENGIANWAIPKELAHFSFHRINGKTEHISVRQPGGDSFFDITLNWGGPSFPTSTAMLPFSLVQEQENNLFYTRFTGNGRSQIARIRECRVRMEEFPDISSVKPIAVFRVDPFRITFPVARIENRTA